jgi:hypothetical protein
MSAGQAVGIYLGVLVVSVVAYGYGVQRWGWERQLALFLIVWPVVPLVGAFMGVLYLIDFVGNWLLNLGGRMCR